MKNQKILLVGDSITECFNTKKLLSNFNIINKGISGNNSRDVLNRIQDIISSENFDIVFILIGTNDIAQGFTDESIINNIKRIADIAAQKVERNNIFITSILPTRNNDLRPNERITELNLKLQKLTNESSTSYLNLHSLFADETKKLNFEYTDDGLHLNDLAYLRWADFLGDFLNNRDF